MDFLILVSEVASKDFLKVSKNESLINLIKEMRKKNTDRALIYRDETPEGIVTKKDIITKVAMSRTRRYPVSALHVSSVMSYPLITIKKDVPLFKAARTMIDKNISSLPVKNGETIIALLTKWDIAEALIKSPAPISQIMTRDVITIRDTDSILTARKLMIEEGFSSLPVLNSEGRLVGIVTLDEIVDTLVNLMEFVSNSGSKSSLKNITVRDCMRPVIPVLTTEDALGTAAALMLEKKVRAVLLVDSERTLRGIVTLTDLTRYVASTYT
ncbi:MAG: CBS domain-containing protein [Desulfurococcaceae archaeon TW002]